MRTLIVLAALIQSTCNAECGVWQTLFDGQTTMGWQEVTGAAFPQSSWIVEEGSLRTVPDENGVQDLRTVRTFGPAFELVWEWRVSRGANSGVKYFIRRVDRWVAKNGNGYQARGRGAEYQIADDAGDRDALRDPARASASLYGKVAPSTRKLRPVGQFNESRIVVRGDQVEHWLNGEKALSYVEPAAVESPIVLQNHNSVVWFRNIRIKEACAAAE